MHNSLSTRLLVCLLMLNGVGLFAAPSIDAVYFAQTHVSKTTDLYNVLVSDRATLLKVHVIDPNTGTAPVVSATLSVPGQPDEQIALTGPGTLPASIPDGPGVVQHDTDASFKGTIPAASVKPGLTVTIKFDGADQLVETPSIGAPNHMVMRMIDVHYFAEASGDYPAGTFDELAQKWPVASLTLNRFAKVVFPDLVIPPRAGKTAIRCTSTADYTAQTGIGFDGEQSAATQWNAAIRDAGGTNRYRLLSYINIYGAPSNGGVAGGFAGVGDGRLHGILHHELGHALGLPHWGDNPDYPYKGVLANINIDPPANYNETHAGPTWAYDSRDDDILDPRFIPPTVQATQVGDHPLGTYKVDPMQGGGKGWQETGFLLNHFSDYSVYKIRNTIQSNMAIWNSSLNEWTKWNTTDNDYTTVVANNGVKYPIQRNVQVITVMASVSGSTPDVNMVYTPIGPYKGNMIRLFDPQVEADRIDAQSIFAPANGCDVTLRIIQGGVEKYYMLAAPWEPERDPINDPYALRTRAVNLLAADGQVTYVELLLTPDAEVNGLPANPTVLYTWEGNMGNITNVKAHRMPTGIYLDWKNNMEYSSIDVYRNGLLLNSVGGSATSHLDGGPLGSGDVTYGLVAVRNGFEFNPVDITVNMDSMPLSALIYEPFEDLDATLTGNLPGTGLTGTWYTRGVFKGNSNQGVSPFTMVYGNLTTDAGRTFGYDSGGWDKSSYVGISPILATADLLDDGNELWFSFLAQSETASFLDFLIGTHGIYEGSAYNGEGQAIGVRVQGDLVTASTWNSSQALGVGDGTIALSTPVLVVGRISWNSDSGSADTVEIYLPGTDLVLPASPVSTASAVLNQSLFDTLCFHGDQADAPHLDEIRFGPNYYSVIAAEDIAPELIVQATATPDTFNTDGNTTLSITAKDQVGRNLTYQWEKVSGPLGPTFVSADASSTIVNGFSNTGNYEFKVTVSNGPKSVSSTVSVVVTSAGNTAPSADSQSVKVTKDKSAAITLTGSDPQSDPLTYTIVNSPTHGTLSGSGQNWTYTPDAGFTGQDSFTFTVNDTEVDSAPATVSIKVSKPLIFAGGGGGGGGGCSVTGQGSSSLWLILLVGLGVALGRRTRARCRKTS